MTLRRSLWLLVVAILCLAGLMAGCNAQKEAEDKLPDTEGGAGESAEQGDSGGEPASVYSGLQSDMLNNYTALFSVEFVAADGSGGWTYRVETYVSGPATMQRLLSITGVAAGRDPGDVVLTLEGDTQYMTGEAVGEASCLIFPATVDLEESFLTPDDFLNPADLSAALKPAGDETVAGQAGKRYTFEARTLGDFTDAAGDIVLAVDGGYVLRYDFSGNTVDTRFTEEQAGRLTWHYEVSNPGSTTPVYKPAACQIDLPLPDDVTDLARLPGLITYRSAMSSEDLLAFYESTLPARGWERYTWPGTENQRTVVTYARAGEFLDISIEAVAGGIEVMLFVEDRPPAP